MTDVLLTPGAETPEPLLPRPFRLVDRAEETPDTFTLVFEEVDGPGMTFRPGQFTMLYVFGVGEVPISIAGNPRMPGSLVHTVRAVGAVTEAICGLRPGDLVGVRGPYGTSWPMDDATDGDLLVVAGGVGLAPLRPGIVEGLTRRHEYSSLSLVYGARTPADLLYKEDLLGWESAHDIDVEVTVDRASSAWRGDVGVVTKLLPRVRFDPPHTTAFVCGPEVMMRVVARELRDRGIPEERIWVSIERNMKCAIGFCGHCQFGPDFACRTGPVMPYERVAERMMVEGL